MAAQGLHLIRNSKVFKEFEPSMEYQKCFVRTPMQTSLEKNILFSESFQGLDEFVVF